MADGIYIAMTGAVARADQLDSIADNLANAQTPGFKASRPAFETFLPPQATGEKAYVAAVQTRIDLNHGPSQGTGNPLDVIPEGDAFLAVAGPDRQPLFTRAGRLTVDADRVLRAAGHPVLGVSGRSIVVPPEVKPEIGADGAVTAGGVELDRLATFRLQGPVTRIGPALLAPGEGGAAVPADGRVRIGELEMGNAGPLEATVQMIGAQRSFDAAMQAIQTYRRLDEKASEVGRVR